jgi:hypothetical protein
MIVSGKMAFLYLASTEVANMFGGSDVVKGIVDFCTVCRCLSLDYIDWDGFEILNKI